MAMSSLVEKGPVLPQVRCSLVKKTPHICGARLQAARIKSILPHARYTPQPGAEPQHPTGPAAREGVGEGVGEGSGAGSGEAHLGR